MALILDYYICNMCAPEILCHINTSTVYTLRTLTTINLIDFKYSASLHTPPTYKPPMLLNTSTQCDLFANFCAGRAGKLDLRKVSLNREHPSTSGCRSNVNKQKLVFDELSDFRCLFVLGLDTKETTEQEQAYFEF